MRRKTVKKVAIKTVAVRSSIQLKSFQHFHVEATADVPEGEEPAYVIDQLKAFVALELTRAKEGKVAPAPPVQGRFLDVLNRAGA